MWPGETRSNVESRLSSVIGMQIDLHQLNRRFEGLRVIDGRRVSQLMSSIAEFGQLAAVLVIDSDAGGWVLIDGYQRVIALEKLSRDTVEATVMFGNEREALLAHLRNETARRRSAIEEGWLLRELRDELGVSLDELAAYMERSKSWVSRRLGLVDLLSDEIQQAIRDGRVPAHAAGKYLVPLARANGEQADRLVAGLGASGATTRQIGRLYAAWRSADGELRDRILDHPLMFLRAEEALSLSGPAFDCDPPLLHDLEYLVAIAHRAASRVRHVDMTQASARVRDEIDTRFGEARRAFERLGRELDTVRADR